MGIGTKFIQMTHEIRDLRYGIFQRDDEISSLRQKLARISMWGNKNYDRAQKLERENIALREIANGEMQARFNESMRNKDNVIARLTEEMTFVQKSRNTYATRVAKRENEICVLRDVISYWEEISAFKDSEIAKYRVWFNGEKVMAKNLQKALLEKGKVVEDQREGIALMRDENQKLQTRLANAEAALREQNKLLSLQTARLENAFIEIETLESELEIHKRNTIQEMCEVPDYEEIPDFAGFSPCGNGCIVKRDGAGRFVDTHEITCDMNEEYESDFMI